MPKSPVSKLQLTFLRLLEDDEFFILAIKDDVQNWRLEKEVNMHLRDKIAEDF